MNPSVLGKIRIHYFSLLGVYFFISVLFFSFSSVSLVLATDFDSSSFIVRDPVISDGGEYSTSNSFKLWSSFAQPAIGISTSNSNELRGGFLYFSNEDEQGQNEPSSSGSGGGGGGNIPLPPSEPPPIPPFFPPFISFIIGEPVATACPDGFSRSDLNCDGEVNLQDLSILFAQPRAITGRTLSFLFSNWTQRLPVPRFATDNTRETTPATEGVVVDKFLSPEFAQIGEVIGSKEQLPETTKPQSTVTRFFNGIWIGLQSIGRFFFRLIGF